MDGFQCRNDHFIFKYANITEFQGFGGIQRLENKKIGNGIHLNEPWLNSSVRQLQRFAKGTGYMFPDLNGAIRFKHWTEPKRTKLDGHLNGLVQLLPSLYGKPSIQLGQQQNWM